MLHYDLLDIVGEYSNTITNINIHLLNCYTYNNYIIYVLDCNNNLRNKITQNVLEYDIF